METFNDRLDTLIKTLKITKTAFAEKLKVTQSYISKLATPGVPVPSDRLIDNICLKFNVSEKWLRTGEGEMFRPLDDEYSFLVAWIDTEDPRMRQSIIDYCHLSNAGKEALWNFVDIFINKK